MLTVDERKEILKDIEEAFGIIKEVQKASPFSLVELEKMDPTPIIVAVFKEIRKLRRSRKAS